LKLVSQAPVAIANVLDCLAGVGFSIAIRGNIRHTQVDAERASNVDRFGCFNLTTREQVPLPADTYQISFTTAGRKQVVRPLSADERDFLPSLECPDRDS